MEREIIRDEMVKVSAKLEAAEAGLVQRRRARDDLYRELHGTARGPDKARRIIPVTPVKSAMAPSPPVVPTTSRLEIEEEEQASARPPVLGMVEPSRDSPRSSRTDGEASWGAATMGLHPYGQHPVKEQLALRARAAP